MTSTPSTQRAEERARSVRVTSADGPAPLADYDCAICLRPVNTHFARYWRGRDALRPPLCRCCEESLGRPATAGAFADRRTVAVGSALAEALLGEASWKQWEASRS